jgi:hypothetical protein
VFAFVAPSTPISYFNIGVNESGDGPSGAPAVRTFSLSSEPGDFSSSAVMARFEGMGCNLNCSVAGSQRSDFAPGRRYYLNVANREGGLPSIGGDRADVFVTVTVPS